MICKCICLNPQWCVDSDFWIRFLNCWWVSNLFLQTTCSYTVLPIHPILWPGSVLSAVHLGHGASAWAAHLYRNHEPQTTGTGQSWVPLSKTGSYGKRRKDIQVYWNYRSTWCLSRHSVWLIINYISIFRWLWMWLKMSMKSIHWKCKLCGRFNEYLLSIWLRLSVCFIYFILQLLFTLTFWLLVRQSVKENFSKKRKMTTPLQEVTTEGQIFLT